MQFLKHNWASLRDALRETGSKTKIDNLLIACFYKSIYKSIQWFLRRKPFVPWDESFQKEKPISILEKIYEQFNKIFFNCPCCSFYSVIFNFRTYYWSQSLLSRSINFCFLIKSAIPYGKKLLTMNSYQSKDSPLETRVFHLR